MENNIMLRDLQFLLKECMENEKINEELKTNNQLKEEIKILKDKICE